jgi:hypothetical protein
MQFIRFRLTRGYIWLDTQYSQYFVRYFALIVLLFAAYFSVMLSAFQLATGVGAKLGASELVQTAGFWFAISTLLVLGCTVVLPVVWLLVLLIIQYYYIKTAKEGAYERRESYSISLNSLDFDPFPKISCSCRSRRVCTKYHNWGGRRTL